MEAKAAIEEKIVYKIDMVEETLLRHIALVHNKNKDKQTVKELISILSLYLKENPDILSE